MFARTALWVTIVTVAFTGTRTHAVSLGEVVELTRAGIGDAVVIELIQMDAVVYALTPARLRDLKAAGVSDFVLLALLRSGRSGEAALMSTNGTTEAQATDARGARTLTECRRPGFGPCAPGVATLVPVPVPLPVHPARARRATDPARAPGPLTTLGFAGVTGFSSLTTIGGPSAAVTSPGRQPNYWGWGGEKRPGSWNGHSATSR